MSQDLIRIASFDIGKKNFCFYIEEIDRGSLLALKNIPSTRRYNPNGTPTAKMQDLLEEVFANGETILHVNLDLTENCDKALRLDPETFYNMNDELDEYLPYFDECAAFVIEQQMSFGRGKNNPMAMKLGQHCYSYFTFKYGRTKQIVEFPAYHKTQVLGAPKVPGKKTKKGFRWKGMDKRARKKWSVEQAIEILTSRGELDVLEGLTTVAKRDDLADTLTQLQAFKYLTFVEKKL
jgi:hypothetical protein